MFNLTALAYPTDSDVRETEKHPTFTVGMPGSIGNNTQ